MTPALLVHSHPGAESEEDAPVNKGGLEALARRIVALSGRLSAATCRWLLLVADFDARDGCAGFGLPSTAHWLAHACGLANRTAIEHVRVARSLAAHPTLVEEMSAGRLSYSHVRAISRVARPGESALVDDLILIAENGTVRHLESMVRGLRTVRDNVDGVAGPPDESVTFGWNPSSQWRLSARLDPERGAVVESAVRAISTAEDISQTDALIRLAEIALVVLADGKPPPRRLRGDERTAVVVHVDAAQIPVASPSRDTAAQQPANRGNPVVQPAVVDDSTPTPTRSEPRWRPFARIPEGPGLPDAVIERLLCDARIRTAVRGQPGTEPGPDVLSLGRSRRLVSDRQYRALLLRHGRQCAHPGCGRRSSLQAHHVRHWLAGGGTDLSNLVLLCEHHHHTHHDGEFGIESLGRGAFRFLRSDGRELLPHPDPISLAALSDTRIEDDHSDVGDTAATSRWDGSRLNHDYAVATIAAHLQPV